MGTSAIDVLKMLKQQGRVRELPTYDSRKSQGAERKLGLGVTVLVQAWQKITGTTPAEYLE